MSRNSSLDVIRSIAVLLVLFHHAECVVEKTLLTNSVIAPIVRAGWVGVDLFFVLSGFLVSGLLFHEYEKNKKINYTRFLIRRGFKIYPSYYLYIFTTIIVWSYSNPSVLTVKNVCAELFFFTNYAGGLWVHTWSLAVEEHFYFTLCILFFAISKICRCIDTKMLVKIYVLLAISCLMIRFFNRKGDEFSAIKHLFPTHIRIDSLMLGVICQVIVRTKAWVYFKNQKKWGVILLLSGVSLFAPAFFYGFESEWITTYGLLCFSIAAACIVLSCQYFTSKNLAFLATIGKYSYTIYLWHMVSGGWITNRLAASVSNVEVKVFIYIAISIVVGVVMSKIVEIPFLRFVIDSILPCKF